ncbi:MAG: hypothetical protein QOE05_1140 [Actinomycetota bacterium]|nr:hypothetical protein [Actinomycetota bacterium]
MKKPFPWGTVLTAGVLGLLLLGILVYAVLNQGSGFLNPLDTADKKVPGVLKYKETRSHVDRTVKYPQNPPAGGDHNAQPQTCAVYTAAIANEHAVHSLEHGAVWVTYRPDLPAAQVATLKSKVEGNAYRMLSPYPGLKSAVSLQAWGRQIFVDKASDPKVDKFLDAYTQGPQAPENGTCQGVTTTGPLQASPNVVATLAPSPGASGAASAPASAAPTPSK